MSTDARDEDRVETVEPGPWRRKSYALLRRGRQPNTLVVRALEFVDQPSGHALDLGAGPLNDTRLLLQAGFAVDAVDRDPLMLSLAARLNDRRLNAIHDDIRNFAIEPERYSLIVAINTLPFLLRSDLTEVLAAIIGGLARNGILCCTLFSVDDSWAECKPYMTFLTRDEVEGFFTELRPLEFTERVYDGVDADNSPKHWHIFRCIYQK
jgi:SAM-dependent methyltransferase